MTKKKTIVSSPEPRVMGTPFHSRTEAAMSTAEWYRWGDYFVVDVYTDVRQELAAMRERATVNEMSPLWKLSISGPDSLKLINDVVTRDNSGQEVGQIVYTPWCNQEGKVVGDGLILREEEDSFVLVAGPNEDWFKSFSDGLEVDVVDTTDESGILALQGPRSREILESATGTSFSDLAFSRSRICELGGVQVRVIRTGFTGELGYELWVEPDAAEGAWDALFKFGTSLGLVPAGEYAIDIARVEAGLLIIGSDYKGAGPWHGVDSYPDSRQECSPRELNLGRFVDFSKDHFVGRQALVDEETSGGPPYRLIGIELTESAVCKLLESEFGSVLPRVSRTVYQLNQGTQTVGYVTSLTWAYSLGKIIGLAHVQSVVADDGTEVSLVWPSSDEDQHLLDARLTELPFRKHLRK
jgi:aminomethyltransferase